MARKPIQINYFGGNEYYVPCVVILCDDGTIWEKNNDNDNAGKYDDWIFIGEAPQVNLKDLDLGEATCSHCGSLKRNKYAACDSCGSKKNKE